MVNIILCDESGNLKKNYSINKEFKIIDLKKIIINDYYQGNGYIDLYFLLDKTKRTFGKFNLDPGLMPRTLDNRSLENFGLENDEIKVMVKNHINDIPKTIDKKNLSSNNGKYVPPNRKKILEKEVSNLNEFVYKEDDFPSLKTI